MYNEMFIEIQSNNNWRHSAARVVAWGGQNQVGLRSGSRATAKMAVGRADGFTLLEKSINLHGKMSTSVSAYIS